MKLILKFKPLEDVKLRNNKRYLVLCDSDELKEYPPNTLIDSRWFSHSICTDGSDEGPWWEDIDDSWDIPILVAEYPTKISRVKSKSGLEIDQFETEEENYCLKLELEFKPINEIEFKEKQRYILFCKNNTNRETNYEKSLPVNKIIVSEWNEKTEKKPYNWPQLCELWDSPQMACEYPREIEKINFASLLSVIKANT